MKNKELKIVTIGAGSSYTPELAEGLLKRYEDLPITEWWLVDIKSGEKKLNIIFDLVQRMVVKSGLPIKVYKTLDRAKAVTNADFITTQLRVGQLEARELDEYIPLKHGLIGQETNGAGGMFKALRTIPVILDIVNDVIKYSKPNAWIINFTNPSGLVSEAINSLTDFKRFIGVCNVPIHMKMDVAKILDTTVDHITSNTVGLNHLSYFTNFFKDGKDVTQKIIEYMMDPEKSKDISMKNISNLAWNADFIKDLNAIPSSYHRYYYKTPTVLKEYKEMAKTKQVRATVVKEIEKSLFKKYEDVNLDHKPKELEERGGAYYSDVAAGVLKAIYADTNEEFAVNVINNGKILNLPNEWTVEATSKIGKNGAVKLERDLSLPKVTIGLIHTIKSYELRVVEAVKQKKISLAYLALVSNPLANDDEIARKVFTELIQAHKKYLTYYDDVE